MMRNKLPIMHRNMKNVVQFLVYRCPFYDVIMYIMLEERIYIRQHFLVSTLPNRHLQFP